VIFKYCKKSFPCVKNTNGILKYETLIYKEISYIHVDRYSKYRAMGILKIPHTPGESVRVVGVLGGGVRSVSVRGEGVRGVDVGICAVPFLRCAVTVMVPARY
jgi:hypothetical protein